jgi:hypothetical protein
MHTVFRLNTAGNSLEGFYWGRMETFERDCGRVFASKLCVTVRSSRGCRWTLMASIFTGIHKNSGSARESGVVIRESDRRLRGSRNALVFANAEISYGRAASRLRGRTYSEAPDLRTIVK